MRRMPVLLLALLVASRAFAAEPPGADAFATFGGLALGEELAASGSRTVVEPRPDGTSVWNEGAPVAVTPELVLSRVTIVTYKGLVLSLSGIATTAAFDAWAAGLASREGTRVRITSDRVWAPGEEEFSGDSGWKTRITFESLVVEGIIRQDARAAELKLSESWKGTFTGVDARLDPRVAAALDSASAKYGWAATLKFGGALTLAGTAVGVYLAEDVSKQSLGTAALGVALVVVGAVLGQSAGNDIASVTTPR